MGFINMKDITNFCNHYKVSRKFLKYHLQYNAGTRFRRVIINELNNKKRIIHIPRPEYKVLLNKIKNDIEEIYKPGDFVVGFVKDKSIIDGAKKHINKDIVINIDIKDYFHSINFGRVRGLFKSKPFNFNNYIATLLANIVTFDDQLPMGSPTSPIISNMITWSLDYDLYNYLNKHGFTYTRYADDITFSSNNLVKIPKGIIKDNDVGFRIKNIIEKQGFKINEKKTRLSNKYMNQSVTNVKVNTKLNVQSKFKYNLRASLHNVRESEDLKYINDKKSEIRGKLNYLSMVKGKEDYTFLKYAKEYNELYGVNHFNCDLVIPLESYIEDRILVITKDEESNGTGFIVNYKNCYYLVTATHVILDKDFFHYFYHGDKTIFAPPLKFNNFNKTEDIIAFKINEKNVKKVGKHFKSFKLTDKDHLELEVEITLAGYEEYYDKTEKHVQINGTQITSRQTVDEKKGRYQLKQNIIRHGMSGGPVLDRKTREIVGVVYYGGHNQTAYISFLNKVLFEKIIAS